MVNACPLKLTSSMGVVRAVVPRWSTCMSARAHIQAKGNSHACTYLVQDAIALLGTAAHKKAN